MSLNKKIYVALNLFIFASFVFGFYVNENSAGGGPGDYNHIANNYSLIFSNELQNIDWAKYESSRFPLHYFLTKTYLPLSFDVIKLNNFLISTLIPIIVFFSVYLKYNKFSINNHLSHFIVISFLIYLSPYFRTTAYWMLEENFGIFFLVSSSYFLFTAIDQNSKKKTLNIGLNLFLIYCAFFCSQNLFVFVIINFILLIKHFWNDKKIIILICFLNTFFLFAPFIFFYDVLSKIIFQVTSSRAEFQINNIVDLFSIAIIYLIPVSLICIETKKSLFFFKKNFLIIFIFYIIFLLYFWQYESVVLGGGALKKLLLFIFNESEYYKFFLLTFSFLGIILSIKIIKIIDFNLIFFLVPYSIYILFLDFVFQEYLDPLLLVYFILYTNVFKTLSEKKIIFLVSYFFIFLVGANVYYLLTL